MPYHICTRSAKHTSVVLQRLFECGFLFSDKRLSTVADVVNYINSKHSLTKHITECDGELTRYHWYYYFNVIYIDAHPFCRRIINIPEDVPVHIKEKSSTIVLNDFLRLFKNKKIEFISRITSQPHQNSDLVEENLETILVEEDLETAVRRQETVPITVEDIMPAIPAD